MIFSLCSDYSRKVQDLRFFEFFAGGGMARAGLGARWQCAFANDLDAGKGAIYRLNWPGTALRIADVNDLEVDELPGQADLVWASFPCQDLSLAGNKIGLGTLGRQTRSGAFWAFSRLMDGLREADRAPTVVVLENVYGALTANGGRDFAAIVRQMTLTGYRVGAAVIDAADFVPQSRVRVFVVAVRREVEPPAAMVRGCPDEHYHPPAMIRAIDRLSEFDREQWLWIVPGPTPPRQQTLADVVEEVGPAAWHRPAETRALVAMMNRPSEDRLKAMLAASDRRVGTLYRRTRLDEHGRKCQRAELRTDGLAGCLRTPGGGSSRQTVVVTDNQTLRTRLMTAREAARLMGLPDSYRLPERYNEAYHLAGDGVVVPVVRHIADTIIEPLVEASRIRMAMAA